MCPVISILRDSGVEIVPAPGVELASPSDDAPDSVSVLHRFLDGAQRRIDDG